LEDIQDEDLVGDKRIKDPKPNQLLLALRFLKQYPTKETLAGFGSCTEKHCTCSMLEVYQGNPSTCGKEGMSFCDLIA